VVIARCANAAAVRICARSRGLELSVRDGSHGSAGHPICDDGVMIGLSMLRRVDVDPVERRARLSVAAMAGATTARSTSAVRAQQYHFMSTYVLALTPSR
jgi:FAD/FMN-containing dehydrogenase